MEVVVAKSSQIATLVFCMSCLICWFIVLIYQALSTRIKPVVPTALSSDDLRWQYIASKYPLILRDVGELGLYLLLFFVFDGPPNAVQNMFPPPAERVHSADMFWGILFVVLFLAYCLTTTQIPVAKNGDHSATPVLARQQTDEWKGAMQLFFLLYHYYKTKEVYNYVRVMIAAYVFLTGYGHASYFRKTGNFGWHRILKMVFRLNFLALASCLTLNLPYMLYYICPVHTLWFLLTYVVCFIQHYTSPDHSIGYSLLNVLLVTTAVIILWDLPSEDVFQMLWHPLTFILEYRGSLHEWYFRTRLDHLIWLLGIGFAIIQVPIIDRYLMLLPTSIIAGKTNVEGGDQGFSNFASRNFIPSLAQLLTGFFLSLFTIVWVFEFSFRSRFVYNETHPFLSWIPILFYIMVRNSSEVIRKRYSYSLQWFGQITMETYIAQHHIWLRGNAKKLLFILGPEWPFVNFIVVSIAFILISRRLYHICNSISTNCLPADFKTIIMLAGMGLMGWSITYVMVYFFS